MGNGSSKKLICFIVLIVDERKRVHLVRYPNLVKFPTSVMRRPKTHGTALRSVSGSDYVPKQLSLVSAHCNAFARKLVTKRPQ